MILGIAVNSCKNKKKNIKIYDKYYEILPNAHLVIKNK